MGVQERRAREKEELRTKILQAATELFIEEGFENVSMRKVADRIEYSPSTIYLYFKDKADLCRTICHETFDKLKRRLEEIGTLGLLPEEGMRRSLRAYIEFGLENPQHYIFTLCLPEPPPDNEWSAVEQQVVLTSGLATFDLLRQGVAGCMEAGVFRRQDVDLTSQLIWAMLHGLTSLLITSPSFPFLDQNLLIDAQIDHIMRALRP